MKMHRKIKRQQFLPERVSFEKVDATEFVVPDQADRMYFFNPFSVEILQHVIARILESLLPEYETDPIVLLLSF